MDGEGAWTDDKGSSLALPPMGWWFTVGSDERNRWPAMTDIGVAVLLFNHWPEAGAVLDALFRQTVSPSKVVVVDNASSCDPTTDIRGRYPEATVLRAERNGGYAAGMNLAMGALAADEPDAYLLLTHDCVLADTALQELSEALGSDPELGVVGPLLGYAGAPTRVFSAGGTIDHASWKVRHRRTPADLAEWPRQGVERVAWLDGSCMLLRRRVVEVVGAFDERYFLYYEDVDYCLRAQRHGFGVACAVGARAWQQPSDNLTREIRIRNQLVLMRSNGASGRALVSELARGARHALPPNGPKRKMAFTEWLRCAASGLRM